MSNMFRCTLASGGGALVLTVTCDSGFAGQTITCTDGTTTLTQICPSTSPYTVEFKIPNGGTWTISSGTASTSVTIPSSAELHNIPNGSTITPTDDIQIWLHCANIWDKAYTTISQVLADASTLQALIASNNAADYMARSTTWASDVTADQSAMSYIGLNDYCADTLLADSTWGLAICNSSYFDYVLTTKVPTMTSNTTPSGKISSNATVHQTNYLWLAFDGNNSTYAYWTNTSNPWIQYEFTEAVCIKKVSVIPHYSSQFGLYAKGFTIEAYNEDTSQWDNFVTDTFTNTSGERTYTLNNDNKYKKYRFSFTNTTYANGANWAIETLQYYGR